MRKSLPLILLLLVALAFLAGLFQLFKLRFEAGDVYPEYSSLRADPLGTMALYESLERLPGVSVRRDYSAGNRLPEARSATYLHLAASRFDWLKVPEDLAKEIDGFMARGGRLVITFLPEDSQPLRIPPAVPAPSGKTKKGKQAQTDDDRRLRLVSLKERWGVEFRVVPLESAEGAAHKPVRVENQTDLPLPESLEWHSAVVLTNLSAAWETLYARGASPVLVERRFGAGSVVLATDSYFFSNEALSKERHADLLAWLVDPSAAIRAVERRSERVEGRGSRDAAAAAASPPTLAPRPSLTAKQVVFDEAHFGIVENAGTASLMRKYRLHGLGAGLILLAGLFIWKNALSFVPPDTDETGQAQVAGRDAAAGFVNLLRRNIAPRDVLRVCFDEWTKSLGQGSSHSIARVDRAQAVLEAEAARARTSQDPVHAYKEICAVLKGKT